jgi:hypothetical protein
MAPWRPPGSSFRTAVLLVAMKVCDKVLFVALNGRDVSLWVPGLAALAQDA